MNLEPSSTAGTVSRTQTRRLLSPGTWMSVAYACYFGAVGFFFPYIGLHYHNLGLSGQQIGMISAIGPLATALLAPMWGMVADLYNAHRLILRLTLAPVAIVVILLAQATSFVTILPLIILHSIFLAPVMPFMDGYGVAVSERYKLSFGQMRFWGTVGFITCVFLIGQWMGGQVTPFFLYAYAAGVFLACLVTFGLPPLDINTSRPDWGDALGLLRQRPMLILIASSWLVSIGFSSFNTFFSIYLAEMNGTHLIGIANITLAASELPVLFYSNQLVERLGTRRMLTIGIIGYALRFTLMSVAPSAAWVVPIQLLHTFSFTFYMLASVRMAHQLGGRELAATAQSLLASATALGSITGALVGGILLDWIGVFLVFRLAGMMALVALVVFTLGMGREKR